MNVCDIGCGYGATSRFLMENHQVDVTALTISRMQYDYAVSCYNNAKRPKYILCDFLKNSLSSEQFDIALSIESSEHMVDKRLFFHEAYRILKPKGKMVVCAWLAKDKLKQYEIRFLIEPICSEGHLPSLGSENDYRQFMAEAGFQNIQSTPLTNRVKKTWNICIKRSFKAFFSDLEFLKSVLNPNFQNRVFLKTMFRIWAAYRLGSMEYSLFIGEK
jgi:tocopherol O-methyltransferase